MNKNGKISAKELGDCFAKLGENVPGYKLRELVQQVDKDKNGTIELQEFIEVIFLFHLLQLFTVFNYYRCFCFILKSQIINWQFCKFENPN